jgi:hypothetical protein
VAIPNSNKLSPNLDVIQSIDITLVDPDPDQPRKFFAPAALDQLKIRYKLNYVNKVGNISNY